MKRFWEELRCIAWPPYRKQVDRNRAWWMVFDAAMHLMQRPDWGRGDYGAGKLLKQKLDELNR